MNELEATRAKLKCLEMVEGTSLCWWEVVLWADSSTANISFMPEVIEGCLRTYDIEELKFALGIVEGKPVWVGDVYYHKEEKLTAKIPMQKWFYSECTRNPPKPKTVMVELLVEDAEVIAKLAGVENRASTACRKALGEMK